MVVARLPVFLVYIGNQHSKVVVACRFSALNDLFFSQYGKGINLVNKVAAIDEQQGCEHLSVEFCRKKETKNEHQQPNVQRQLLQPWVFKNPENPEVMSDQRDQGGNNQERAEVDEW